MSEGTPSSARHCTMATQSTRDEYRVSVSREARFCQQSSTANGTTLILCTMQELAGHDACVTTVKSFKTRSVHRQSLNPATRAFPPSSSGRRIRLFTVVQSAILSSLQASNVSPKLVNRPEPGRPRPVRLFGNSSTCLYVLPLLSPIGFYTIPLLRCFSLYPADAGGSSTTSRFT